MEFFGMQELVAENFEEEAEMQNKENGTEYAGALKKIVGVFLIVVAAVFGGLLTRMPDVAAFAVVFAYIFLQMRIWLN